MYNRVMEYIKKYEMLSREDNVLVGLSGGPDSVCLLFMLLELKEQFDLKISAVHINHGLRGEGALRDEEYVSNLCHRKNIPLKIVRENVMAFARENHMSIEEGGREIRKKAFLETAEMWGAGKIALGHNQDDNAETMLYNLCRGSDMTGLGGMSPTDGLYIRPLLGVRKRTIVDWLTDRGITYCIDETNAEEVYIRNRMRHRMIPDMESFINSKAVVHIARTAEKLREINDYIKTEVKKYVSECISFSGGGELCLFEKGFHRVPETLKNDVLYEAICLSAGRRKDIREIHVMLLRDLLKNDVGKKICLPYEITAYRDYDGLMLCKDNQYKKPENPGGAPPFKEYYADENKLPATFIENPYTKWFDCDIIRNTVEFRTYREGDFITIDKEGSKQKLRRFFINNKVPHYKRDTLWLVADGSEIMWIVGYRQNMRYQITDYTKRAVKIVYMGGEFYGRDYKNND